MTTSSTTCPDCGTPRTRDTLDGQCPACLLRTALVVGGVGGEPREGAGRTSAPAGGGEARAGAFASPFSDPSPPRNESPSRTLGEASSLDLIGSRIGRYRLIERLAGGGMGAVYRALDERLGRSVAFKLVVPERVGDPAARARFEVEARAASALEHPNVCAVYDVGDSEHGPYLVLPLYEGETLAQRLERGPLPVERALDVVRQTAEGLMRAHREGIVHGDVKPENLMLTADGLVKVLDFGLAGAAGERGRPGGTEGYLPPEIARGARVDPRADLYALGVVLVEALLGRGRSTAPGAVAGGAGPATLEDETSDAGQRAARAGGRPPEPGRRDPLAPPTASPSIPPLEPDLDALIAACLEPDPDRRISSARDVLAALDRIDPLRVMVALGELPSPDAVAAARWDPAPGRRGAAAAGALLAVSLAIAGWLVVRWDRWSELAPRRGLASLVETAEAASGVATAQAAVRWGLALDRDAWAGAAEERERAVLLWWRAADSPLIGSPIVVRALDLGRVGPTEPPFDERDLARVAVTLDGKVVERTTRRPDRGGATVAAPERETAPWAPSIGGEEPGPALYGFDPLLFVVLFVLLVGITSILARRNLARRQGDRRGAGRLAIVLGVLFLVSWIAGGGHASTLRAEFSLFVQAAGLALFYAALGGLFHLALEPRLRRHWPHVLIGWSRLFAGSLADGVAARELLVGTLTGVVWFLARLAAFGRDAVWASGPVRIPNVRLLEGPGQWTGELANSLGTALALGLGVVVVMALVRERVAWRWAGALLFTFLATPTLALTERGAMPWLFWALVALSAWWLVGRLGALALVAAYLAFRLLWMGMLTLVPGQLGFAVSVGTVVLVLLLGLAPMAARRARAIE